MYALGVLAPLADVGTGVALGRPTPIVSLSVLVIALITRSVRSRRTGRPAAARQHTRACTIERVTTLTPAVVRVRIACAAEPWAPGAHIDLVLPSGKTRQYSLCGDPTDRTGYEIAVLRDDDGRGASREIHALVAGDPVRVSAPRDNFPLVDAPEYLFVAGGIGITPFLPMIAHLDELGLPWQLIYRGRSRATMPFAEELLHRYGARVSVLPADTTPRPDLARLVADQPAGTAVYCCGPASLAEA